MRHYSSKYGVSEFPGEGTSFTKLTMDTMNDSSGAEIKVSLTRIWFLLNFLSEKSLYSWLLLMEL